MQATALGQQRGAALIVGLLMLTMLTLMVLSAVMLSTANLKAVSNMQFRDEAAAAASLAMEQVVNGINTSCQAGTINREDIAQTVNVDLDRDGTTDYAVAIPVPTCLISRQSSDEICTQNTANLGENGLDNTNNANPCEQTTTWQVRAVISDQKTGASFALNQGVSLSCNYVDLDCDE